MGAHLSSPRTEKVSSNGGDYKLDSTIYGSTSMQGWRISMEDAHLTLPNFLFKTPNSNTQISESDNDNSEKLGFNNYSKKLSDFSFNFNTNITTKTTTSGISNTSTEDIKQDEDGSSIKFKGSIYGVFDGHGGNCVSKWVSENFSYIFMNELENLLSTQDLSSNMTKLSDIQTEMLDTTPTDTNTPVNTTLETSVNLSKVDTDTFGTTTPESYLIGKALENSFLKLDEYLQKPEVDKQLHLISTNKKTTDENLFKVLLPDKITNRQHAIDIIQQLTSSYNMTYSSTTNAPSSSSTATASQLESQLNTSVTTRSTTQESINQAEKLNKYDSIPYYSPDSSTEAEGSDQEMEDINTELGLDRSSNNENNNENQEVNLNVDNTKSSTNTEKLETESAVEETVNTELYAMGCGSTSVVAVVLENPIPCVVVANAGDSRCVLSRNKKAVPLSVDHKPTDEPELNRIKKAGGYVINGRVDGNLNLSRSLGDLSFKLDNNLSTREQKIISFPDIKIVPITKDDEFLILACDGIWDCKSNQQVVDYINYKFNLYTETDWDETKDNKKLKSKMKSMEKTATTSSGFSDSVFDAATSASTHEKSSSNTNIKLEGDGTREKKVLERICEELCDMCLSNNPSESEGIGCDNMTIIIVRFNHQLYEKI